MDKTFRFYCCWMYPEFFASNWSWIKEPLTQISENGIENLLLGFPQQSGKSFLITLQQAYYTCLFHILKKDITIMRLCNTDDNVTKFSQDVRNIISSPKNSAFFKSNFKFEVNNNDKFKLVGSEFFNGYFYSVKSAIQSKGADILIIDDPYRDFYEGLTGKIDSYLHNEFFGVWLGRLNQSKFKKIWFCGTRASKVDFFDFIEKYFIKNEKKYLKIIQPALINGKSFCERIKSTSELLILEQENNDLFNAVYQQAPSAQGMIKIFENHKIKLVTKNDLPKFKQIISYSDPAKGRGGDYFVTIVAGFDVFGQITILEIFASRFFSKENYLQNLIALNKTFPYILNFCESFGIGKEIIEYVGNNGIAIEKNLCSTKNKIEKIYQNATEIKQMTFFEKCDNIILAEKQLFEFPLSENDDIPDCLAEISRISEKFTH